MNLTQSTAIHLERYQDLHLSVDFERETALLDGTRMKLTYKAFALLALLVRHPGQLIPRDTLLMLVWGYGADIRTRTLDVHIRRCVRALAATAPHTSKLSSAWGIGCSRAARSRSSKRRTRHPRWHWAQPPPPASGAGRCKTTRQTEN
jgi:DNA-binding response OmpR family regulator